MDLALNPTRKPHLTLRAGSGWSPLRLSELWEFRELLGSLAFRDIRLRYRQTALGVIWVVLQPLLAAGIFSFVFGKVAKLPSDGLPYFVFSYAGLLAWNAFSGTLTKASACLVGNSNLVSKIYFPRLILPLSIVPSTLIDFGVALVLMVVLIGLYHVHVGIALLLMPVWLLLVLLLALGAGLFAAALMVSYRDVQFILPVVVQLLLYGTPIPYAISAVPPQWRTAVLLNPLSELIEAFRWSMIGAGQVSWNWLAYSAVVSVLVFCFGAVSFKNMERKFADVI
jgi:lipopolysaccharide transport system permease protein